MSWLLDFTPPRLSDRVGKNVHFEIDWVLLNWRRARLIPLPRLSGKDLTPAHKRDLPGPFSAARKPQDLYGAKGNT
jgi:hypothetical protein